MKHILYHANCADGFAAACVTAHALGDQNLIAQPITYTDALQVPAAPVHALDQVIYLDYTPPVEAVKKLLIQGAGVHILDHHRTAAATIQQIYDLDEDLPQPEVLFDTARSGAALAWSYAFPGQPMPRPLELLEHYDLGRCWTHRDHIDSQLAQELVAYLMRAIPRRFEAWLPILKDWGGTFHRVLGMGRDMLAQDERIIRAAVEHPYCVRLGPHLVPAVEGLPYGLLNEALHQLLKMHPGAPFAAHWSINSESKGTSRVKWSLRGREGGMDLGAFCREMEPATPGNPGGGGHPQAAGFSSHIPVETVGFGWRKIVEPDAALDSRLLESLPAAED